MKTIGKQAVAKQMGPEAEKGFTLLELLVVLATVALLAVTLLPALAAGRPNNQTMQCGSNLRQLTLAWQMYAQDNGDHVVFPPSAVGGTMGWQPTSTDNTNTALLLNPQVSYLAPYLSTASVFKCPADTFQSPNSPGPRARSYSLDGLLGGSAKNAVNTLPGRTYFAIHKLTDLAPTGPKPAGVLVWLDEQADSINDGVFYENAGMAVGTEKWEDLPGSYHNGACGLSFMDGHVVFHRWTDSRTLAPVLYSVWQTEPNYGVTLASSADFEFVDNLLPYQ
jgi:prepilin-type N-terminal cleavage/methylation domain-containing protein/prepilin-type processing-associated H-X9-DG protein